MLPHPPDAPARDRFAWGPEGLGRPALWLLAPIPVVWAVACAIALRAPGRPRA